MASMNGGPRESGRKDWLNQFTSAYARGRFAPRGLEAKAL